MEKNRMAMSLLTVVKYITGHYIVSACGDSYLISYVIHLKNYVMVYLIDNDDVVSKQTQNTSSILSPPPNVHNNRYDVL